MRVITLLLFAISAACATPPDADGFTPLFNGKDLSGWVPVNVGPATFTVKDGMIVCDGKPTGVMRTEKQYENFIVELEWRHMVPRGNAGFFVWSDPVTARGVPFTRGVEVQVLDGPNGDWYTTHGDIFPIHGAKMTPENGRGGDRAYPTEHLSKPSPEWNHYRVECVDGSITLGVNGKVVTKGHTSSPRKGYLCLESEGGVVHWRNLRIKELPRGENPAEGADVAEVDRGFKSLYTGVDLSGWKTEKTGDHWKSSDWTFFYDGKGSPEQATLWTDLKFKDYDLIFDFRTEGEQDLTVFLRGENGPTLNIGKGTLGLGKPGEWNRVRASWGAVGLFVTINGKPFTVVSVESAVKVPGPLGLRASGLTSFANVYVLSAHP